jgi:hypothetical protein
MTEQTEPDRMEPRRVASAAVAATVVTVLCLVAGFILSSWAARSGQPDSWEGLGRGLFGLAVTLVVYVVVAVVSAVMAFGWALPRGRRAAPILGFVTTAVLMPVLAYWWGFGGLSLAGAVAAMVAVPLSVAGQLRWFWTAAILLLTIVIPVTSR